MLLAEALRDIPSGSCSSAPSTGITRCMVHVYAYVQPDYLADGWSRDRIFLKIISLGYPAFTGSCSEIYLKVFRAYRHGTTRTLARRKTFRRKLA